jgi:hypothetical protein
MSNNEAVKLKVTDRVVTLQVSDTICQALRKASVMRKEANRIKVYTEMLNYNENRALRLDYFTHNLAGLMSTEAKAAAWLADETFYEDDGVNDWPWAAHGAYNWNGRGGGDFTVVDGVFVPVEKQ